MKNSFSALYVFFGILFTSCLLISNIISVKLIQFGSWTITAGIIIFPVAYIVNDVISEIWGFKKARFIIWCGFLMNLLAILIYTAAVAMPASEFWQGQSGFTQILQSTPRLAISSLIAYLTGSFLNSMIMSKMKVKSQGKHFSVRAIASTLAGESADSVIFITIAFAGLVPFPVLLQMIAIQIVVKTLYEILVLPVTIRVVKTIRKYEGDEAFDEGISYNPFKLVQV
jgi:uncharacterized integral membrane protein (TIGR00697 family)